MLLKYQLMCPLEENPWARWLNSLGPGLWLQDTTLQGFLTGILIRNHILLCADAPNVWAMGLHEVDGLDQAHVPDVRGFTRLASRLYCLCFPELPGLIPGKWTVLRQKKCDVMHCKNFPYLSSKVG